MAKEHGGEITYQAREGGGSNVTLRLPLDGNPATAGPSLQEESTST
jgi:signal transduction histidine kinase